MNKLTMLLEVIVVFAAAFVCWRLWSFDHVQVHHNSGTGSNDSTGTPSLVGRLVRRLEILRKPYYFPIWSFDGNVHSLYGNWIRTAPRQKYFREDLIAADGQLIALDWTMDELPDNAPLVFLIPGINGGSYNEYSQYFVQYFRNEGWRVAVYNRPGAKGTRLVNSRIIQFPDAEYVSMLFNHILQRYPRAPLFAVGISLGGNSLLRYLGQKGDEIRGRVLGAVSLSNPFNFLHTMQRIQKAKFYDNWLCRKAVALIRDHAEVMKADSTLDLQEILNVTTSVDFDKAYTMKILALSDYQELKQYYQNNSCVNFLQNIRVPTLIANALDDPLIGNTFIPDVFTQVMANQNLALVTTKHGGHGCWFEGFIVPSSKTWMDRLCVEFVQSMLELQSSSNSAAH